MAARTRGIRTPDRFPAISRTRDGSRVASPLVALAVVATIAATGSATAAQSGWGGPPEQSVIVADELPHAGPAYQGYSHDGYPHDGYPHDGSIEGHSDELIWDHGGRTVVPGPMPPAYGTMPPAYGPMPPAYGTMPPASEPGLPTDAEDGEEGWTTAQAHDGHCEAPWCHAGCSTCGHGRGHGHGLHGGSSFGEPWYNAACEPPGILQHLGHHSGCHTLRADALVLWRNAPAPRPLYTFGNAPTALPALDASGLESPAAGGGRLTWLRGDRCGNAVEMSYLYGGQFFSREILPPVPGGYSLEPNGIFGNLYTGLDVVGAQLVASIQTFEANRRWALGRNMRFISGFRWLQWYEAATIADIYGVGTIDQGQDVFTSTTTNNLFGGQIGLDTLLFQTAGGFRTEGLIKAGAYGNAASQASTYLNLSGGQIADAASVRVAETPASAAFVGEVGLTGVLPLTPNLDFRFGYLGLWVTGLAQPTRQLTGQLLAPQSPALGTLSAKGSTIVQGVSLGLEGRW
jgi:hypothetical protein